MDGANYGEPGGNRNSQRQREARSGPVQDDLVATEQTRERIDFLAGVPLVGEGAMARKEDCQAVIPMVR